MFLTVILLRLKWNTSYMPSFQDDF